eukprot:2808622-Heterocapsa_arctica.AAC.1
MEHLVDERHDHLRETAAQVTPASSSGVRCSNHGDVEEDRVPELVPHEGGAESGHEEPGDDQA